MDFRGGISRGHGITLPIDERFLGFHFVVDTLFCTLNSTQQLRSTNHLHVHVTYIQADPPIAQTRGSTSRPHKPSRRHSQRCNADPLTPYSSIVASNRPIPFNAHTPAKPYPCNPTHRTDPTRTTVFHLRRTGREGGHTARASRPRHHRFRAAHGRQRGADRIERAGPWSAGAETRGPATERARRRCPTRSWRS